MIEITTPLEIKLVSNEIIRTYLQHRFKEIGTPPNPLTEGSFVYVEDFHQLSQPHSLIGVTLPSIEQGLFAQTEAVAVFNGIIEITLLFNNEYLLSIVLEQKLCSKEFLALIGLEVPGGS